MPEASSTCLDRRQSMHQAAPYIVKGDSDIPQAYARDCADGGAGRSVVLGVARLGDGGTVGEDDDGDARATRDAAGDMRRLGTRLEVDVLVVDAGGVEHLLGSAAVTAPGSAVHRQRGFGHPPSLRPRLRGDGP